MDGTFSVGQALSGATSNRERAGIVARQLQSGAHLDLQRKEDQVAEHRMIQLLDRPSEVLPKIHRYIQACLRRFYRQRNLILHAGKTDPLALHSSLATAAPLIGAGIDRIHHAFITEGITPVALAARAQLGLATLETSVKRQVWELLEP